MDWYVEKWFGNSIYLMINDGYNRTQIIQAAIKAGEKVNIKRTIERYREDKSIYVVMEDGEEFHGYFKNNQYVGFSRINPIKQACYGMLPGLQL